MRPNHHSAGFTIFNSANTSWSETAITYNTKLTAGTTVRGSGTLMNRK